MSWGIISAAIVLIRGPAQWQWVFLLGGLQIGGMTSIAGTAALLSIVAAGMHSDRTGERRRYDVWLALLAAAGWMLCTCRASTSCGKSSWSGPKRVGTV